uniref:Uncharacterized protein LOC104235518 n=1 Tax=Nicotiana sylvestris TaxID=4096 RepID=A0A1U7X9S8_NICSY|nr:PREDICTED: uncharacterized protein LOC104235518 [Nicotiana sylvestris]
MAKNPCNIFERLIKATHNCFGYGYGYSPSSVSTYSNQGKEEMTSTGNIWTLHRCSRGGSDYTPLLTSPDYPVWRLIPLYFPWSEVALSTNYCILHRGTVPRSGFIMVAPKKSILARCFTQPLLVVTLLFSIIFLFFIFLFEDAILTDQGEIPRRLW